MKQHLVLLSGPQGSGKTTLQTEIVAQARTAFGYNTVDAFNFADPIYKMHDAALLMLESFGVSRRQKDGLLLQLIGTEWGRKTLGENCWVDIMKKRLELFELQFGGPQLVVIADCRFKNEFDGFPGALRVRLECEEYLRKSRTHAWRENTQHPSEIDLDGYALEGRFDMSFVTSGGHGTPKEHAEQILTKLRDLEAHRGI